MAFVGEGNGAQKYSKTKPLVCWDSFVTILAGDCNRVWAGVGRLVCVRAFAGRVAINRFNSPNRHRFGSTCYALGGGSSLSDSFGGDVIGGATFNADLTVGLVLFTN
jgi:hypothetical protein